MFLYFSECEIRLNSGRGRSGGRAASAQLRSLYSEVCESVCAYVCVCERERVKCVCWGWKWGLGLWFLDSQVFNLETFGHRFHLVSVCMSTCGVCKRGCAFVHVNTSRK